MPGIAKIRFKTNLPISFGFTVVFLFFVASGLLSYLNIRMLSQDSAEVVRTHNVIRALDELESTMKDTETGQRGYVLTGDTKYLEPYTDALNHIEERISNVEQLLAKDPEQLARVPVIKTHVHAKLQELGNTIALRRTKGFDAALEVVKSDQGKNEMDAFRAQTGQIHQQETEKRKLRLAEMEKAYAVATTSGIATGLLGILLSLAVAYLLQRAATARRRQDWLQAGEAGLSTAMLGDQRIEKLGDNVLTFLAEYFDAQAGAFFAKDGNDFRRVSTYGVPATATIPTEFKGGDGLLGQAVRDERPFFVHDVPDGYLSTGSALGQGNPRQIVIAPAMADGSVHAVLELGLMRPLDEAAIELMTRVSEAIGVAVQSANFRSNLQNLLEETQRQAEELQAQSEELRVSNEELEEQSRALKESQVRLEMQQTELEQTNAQLEEQTQLLEGQRDDLERTQTAVQQKAKELEQASQYKSDFLANMSHELRTPLNSSLILAKLLADNPNGNLTEEQIKFAQTIQNSGNDLLALINDILDLSKIEAGHMEVRVEPVSLSRLANDLTQVIEPMVKNKGLTFRSEIAADCPDSIETDRMRLEQIIKNLLSNATKFTEKGGVELVMRRTESGAIAFDVTDTGIGIAKEQQQIIFEAFRQADGTISRKFGGTGLGLSISRELTRLLGGHITLTSEPGQGSTFTVTIPEIYNASLIMPRVSSEPMASPPIREKKKENTVAVTRTSRIKDDRENLIGAKRALLVVEDDEAFGSILFDLAHELDFQCLVATSAEEAIIVARQYMPSAVILDIGLPDHSGLFVLDRLKSDPRTRHIPVHVVSADDYAQTALSLGATGYMIKPVLRQDLVKTLKQLETKFSQHMRRVLIVEDDQVQQDSMRKLLGSHDVETVGVGTAAECLDLLKSSEFDCMVLDLSLPDATGYALLETLSKEDAYSFPPVIVYTGRDLSIDEEQKLRRYSKSIIIKGAKSPERLLDEVTLFLHQVVAELPVEQQKMLEQARNRDTILEGKRILVVEDDVANVFALTSILEPRGVQIKIARNGHEALAILSEDMRSASTAIDLVLMDVMMPEMDGMTATREIRKNKDWKKLPIIMLTAKAMRDDQERCLDAGANDYMAKPLDVEKLLSLVRVWLPR